MRIRAIATLVSTESESNAISPRVAGASPQFGTRSISNHCATNLAETKKRRQRLAYQAAKRCVAVQALVIPPNKTAAPVVWFRTPDQRPFFFTSSG